MKLNCIGDILNLQVPSLLRNELSAAWYKVNIGKLLKISPEGVLKYHLNLTKPYNDKLRYYDLIISNCVTTYLNEFRISFGNSNSIEHQKFLVDKYLSREIIQMIDNLSKIITSKNLQWANHNKPDFRSNRELIFIMQTVKYNLIWLYLEIKGLTESVVTVEFQTLETLLAEYFYDYEPDDSIIAEKTIN